MLSEGKNLTPTALYSLSCYPLLKLAQFGSEDSPFSLNACSPVETKGTLNLLRCDPLSKSYNTETNWASLEQCFYVVLYVPLAFFRGSFRSCILHPFRFLSNSSWSRHCGRQYALARFLCSFSALDTLCLVPLGRTRQFHVLTVLLFCKSSRLCVCLFSYYTRSGYLVFLLHPRVRGAVVTLSFFL